MVGELAAVTPRKEPASDPCVARWLGRVRFLPAWELQRRVHRLVSDGHLANQLLLLEHPHVYTLGRRAVRADVLAGPEFLARHGVEVHDVDRGGQVTYHGPGQLVGYPIADLRRWGGGPLQYVRALEKALVATLREFDIEAGSADRPTGVWVGDAKVAAIGVRVSRGVTMHGFALNVDPDLSFFEQIVPCGMPDVRVSSMSALAAGAVSVEEVVPVLGRCLGESLGWTMEWGEAACLDQAFRPNGGASGGDLPKGLEGPVLRSTGVPTACLFTLSW